MGHSQDSGTIPVAEPRAFVASVFRATGSEDTEARRRRSPRRRQPRRAPRIPSIFAEREFVEAGGLIAYGPSLAEQFRHAAVFVDKVLKGAKPANLPIEQATQFELAINLKTAKALAITFPSAVVQRATMVIE